MTCFKMKLAFSMQLVFNYKILPDNHEILRICKTLKILKDMWCRNKVVTVED